MFVFDKAFHTVPDEGHLNTGFYHEKNQYMSNIAAGTHESGILGHGSLFIDIFKSNTPYDTILTDAITDETDLLYLIEPWPCFNGLKEKEGLEGISNPRMWDSVLLNVPEKILQLAKDKRLTILFHIPEFTTALDLIDSTLKNRCVTLEIPESQFKFISGIKYDGWYYWPGFEYSQLVNHMFGDKAIPEVNLKRRKKKFTCLNRIDKGHRRYVAVNLWKRELVKSGFFSFSFGKFKFDGTNYVLGKTEWDEDPGEAREYDAIDWDMPYYEWKKFYDTGPWTADELTIEEHNHHWHVEAQHYKQAYWNFVTETGIEDVPFLSEKTFKPIINLQPFIIMGGCGSLKLLQDLGYKTFGEYIDESYDSFENPQVRVKAATRQAINLAKMTHKEHIKLIKQIKPILEHNQQHFFSSKNRIENFVKYIHGADPAYNWLKDCKYA